jgi:hypothetical protein
MAPTKTQPVLPLMLGEFLSVEIQAREADSERLCYSSCGIESRITDSPLYHTDISGMKARPLGELLLRNASSRTSAADA